ARVHSLARSRSAGRLRRHHHDSVHQDLRRGSAEGHRGREAVSSLASSWGYEQPVELVEHPWGTSDELTGIDSTCDGTVDADVGENGAIDRSRDVSGGQASTRFGDQNDSVDRLAFANGSGERDGAVADDENRLPGVWGHPAVSPGLGEAPQIDEDRSPVLMKELDQQGQSARFHRARSSR